MQLIMRQAEWEGEEGEGRQGQGQCVELEHGARSRRHAHDRCDFCCVAELCSMAAFAEILQLDICRLWSMSCVEEPFVAFVTGMPHWQLNFHHQIVYASHLLVP